MSQNPTASKSSANSQQSIFRRERWLTALILALIPAVMAFVAPESARPYLLVAMLALGAVSLFFLVTHREDEGPVGEEPTN